MQLRFGIRWTISATIGSLLLWSNPLHAHAFTFDDPPIVEGTWYYCDVTNVYYPWVQGCATAWRTVPATPGEAMPPQPPAWAKASEQGEDPMWNARLQEITAEYKARVQAADDLRRQQEAQRIFAQRAQSRRIADEKLGYRYISVIDFELDKRKFVTGAKLIIRGYLEPLGETNYLVETPGIPYSPKIGLIVDDAPRDIRETFLRCRVAQVCAITLSGHVGACTHTLMGSAYKNDRCLYVDGRR